MFCAGAPMNTFSAVMLPAARRAASRVPVVILPASRLASIADSSVRATHPNAVHSHCPMSRPFPSRRHHVSPIALPGVPDVGAAVEYVTVLRPFAVACAASATSRASSIACSIVVPTKSASTSGVTVIVDGTDQADSLPDRSTARNQNACSTP